MMRKTSPSYTSIWMLHNRGMNCLINSWLKLEHVDNLLALPSVQYQRLVDVQRYVYCGCSVEPYQGALTCEPSLLHSKLQDLFQHTSAA